MAEQLLLNELLAVPIPGGWQDLDTMGKRVHTFTVFGGSSCATVLLSPR